ncbi:hypothetical protein AAVH_27941, partial [Aphelenchoides avenae]
QSTEDYVHRFGADGSHGPEGIASTYIRPGYKRLSGNILHILRLRGRVLTRPKD